MVHIVSVAKNISDDIIERFSNSVKESKPSCQYCIKILGKNDISSRFYKSRLLNEGIRMCSGNLNDVIIQVDIDFLTPPLLIDYTLDQAKKGIMFHHETRYVSLSEIDGKTYDEYDWDSWSKLKPHFCSGGWNGMTVEKWMKSKGYNEMMYGWGGEDTEFYQRASKLGIKFVSCNKFPLVHVGHERRGGVRPKENMVLANKYPNRNWIQDGLPDGEE